MKIYNREWNYKKIPLKDKIFKQIINLFKRTDIQYIALVNVEDIPEEILDWCDNNGYSGYQIKDIFEVSNNGNPFTVWLINKGYIFHGESDYIGIIRH